MPAVPYVSTRRRCRARWRRRAKMRAGTFPPSPHSKIGIRTVPWRVFRRAANTAQVIRPRETSHRPRRRLRWAAGPRASHRRSKMLRRRRWSPLPSPTRRRRSQKHIQRRRQPLREPTGAAAAPAAAPAPAEDPRADWDDSEDDDAPAADIPAPLPTGWSGVQECTRQALHRQHLRRAAADLHALLLPRPPLRGYAWCDDVDYFHVRNYTPDPRMPARFEEDAKKLATKLRPDEAAAALACSCQADDPRRGKAVGPDLPRGAARRHRPGRDARVGSNVT